MASYLQKRASGNSRSRNLQLNSDSEVPEPPPNVPMSPTDANLSPCSRKLWARKRPMNQPSRQPTQPRAWSSLVEDPRESGSEGSSGEEEEEEEGEGVEGEGNVYGLGEAEEATETTAGPTPTAALSSSSSSSSSSPPRAAGPGMRAGAGAPSHEPLQGMFFSPEREYPDPSSSSNSAGPTSGGDTDPGESAGPAALDGAGPSSGGGDSSSSSCGREGGGAGVTELRVTSRPPPCALPIVLGSSSSNRRAVMERLGWEFTCMSPDVDEKAIRHPEAREMTRLIAVAKADALEGRVERPAVLVTADQVCVFRGTVREKPESPEEARAFLRSYSGDRVETVSAVCATNTETGRRAEGVDVAAVRWGEVPPEVADAVVARGAVLSSAGGFMVQDPGLGPQVQGIDGGVDSVYGLPVDLMCDLIAQVAAP